MFFVQLQKSNSPRWVSRLRDFVFMSLIFSKKEESGSSDVKGDAGGWSRKR